jgi:hypothetical protein
MSFAVAPAPTFCRCVLLLRLQLVETVLKIPVPRAFHGHDDPGEKHASI